MQVDLHVFVNLGLEPPTIEQIFAMPTKNVVFVFTLHP